MVGKDKWVYDGGGGIVASIGLEGQRPSPKPRIDHDEFIKRLAWVSEDFEAGFISPREFGEICEKVARDRMGV